MTDAAIRLKLAELYRRGAQAYFASPNTSLMRQIQDPTRQRTGERVRSSALYLTDHLHEVPVHVIPCVSERPEGKPLAFQATYFGSIVQAAWSFMLAARARGLGTCWTTMHLSREREVADLLDIPYERVTQVALLPVAYTKGTDFKPASRQPLADVLHWDAW